MVLDRNFFFFWRKYNMIMNATKRTKNNFKCTEDRIETELNDVKYNMWVISQVSFKNIFTFSLLQQMNTLLHTGCVFIGKECVSLSFSLFLSYIHAPNVWLLFTPIITPEKKLRKIEKWWGKVEKNSREKNNQKQIIITYFTNSRL